MHKADERCVRRVLLVEPDAHRRGVLQLRLECVEPLAVAFALTGVEALVALRRERFDLVIASSHLADSDAIAVCQRVHVTCPNLPMIIYVDNMDTTFERDALRAGAFACLDIKTAESEWQAALLAVWHGLVICHRETIGRLTGRVKSEPASLPELTSREIEVIELLIAGLSNAEIAARLGVSSRTVSSHVSHILSKLDVKRRTAAVALWLHYYPQH